MQFSFLVPIVSFLGLAAGMALAHIASDEIGPGRKVLDLLRKLILAAIIVLSFGYGLLNYSVLTLIFSIIAASFLIPRIRQDGTRLDYLFLGCIAAAGLCSPKFFLLLLSSLIFLHGIACGGLLKERNAGTLGLHAVMFFLPMLLLLAKFINDGIILGFSAAILFFHLKSMQ